MINSNVVLIESMIKNKINMNSDICYEFLKPLIYAYRFEDSVTTKKNIQSGTIITCFTENDNKLNINSSLAEYDSHNVLLRLEINNNEIVIDYNFFLANNGIYKSKKSHMKYSVDILNNKIVKSSDLYASEYKGISQLKGSEVAKSLYQEYDLEHVITSEIKNFKRIDSSKEEQRLLAEIFKNEPPIINNGKCISYERLIDNQAIKYTSPDRYELVYLNPDVLDNFEIIEKKPKRIDKLESSILRKKYTYKKA